MSLITRCPACGTMFKVVTDQLKVSQGWVRCGHCAEVFDASAHLLPRDMSSLSAPTATLAPAPEPPPEFDRPTEPQSLPMADPPVEPARQEWAPARSFADRAPLRPSSPGWEEAQDSAADFDPARWKRAQQERQHDPLELPAEPLPEAPLPRQPAMVSQAIEDDSSFAYSDVDSGMPGQAVQHDVSFVREARRKAFWRKPLTRLTLLLLSLLLLATLVAQWAVQQRDMLAALEPRLLSPLQALCGPLHCEIRPPRHIEALVIDSSTFNRVAPDVYRLSFTLKNTGVATLEMPSLEVTLTDTQDQAVVRRILSPAQFGAKGATLAAQSELAGLVIMKVSGEVAAASPPSASATSSSSSPAPSPLRVAGYRVLAFYP
jgi:predicted Zn finger-like uncharacterized protein